MSENAISTAISLLFIFFATTLGSALTYVISDKYAKKFFSVLSGFAVGVMLAASVWSLIIPSIENSSFEGAMRVAEATVGFIFGGAFMIFVAKTVDGKKEEDTSFLSLFTAITMHNIPEGLAVGFSFGAAATGSITVAAAIAVAFGIGIQNIPEGAAISLSARRFASKKKSFVFGALSGVVEPVSGLIGYFFAGTVKSLLPYFMSFAAGAMVFASVTDLLPDSLSSGKIKTGVGVMLGFLIMMCLDVILG